MACSAVDDVRFNLGGLTCERWQGVNCFVAAELLGFTATEESSLLQACPSACGVGNCGSGSWQPRQLERAKRREAEEARHCRRGEVPLSYGS